MSGTAYHGYTFSNFDRFLVFSFDIGALMCLKYAATE